MLGHVVFSHQSFVFLDFFPHLFCLVCISNFLQLDLSLLLCQSLVKDAFGVLSVGDVVSVFSLIPFLPFHRFELCLLPAFLLMLYYLLEIQLESLFDLLQSQLPGLLLLAFGFLVVSQVGYVNVFFLLELQHPSTDLLLGLFPVFLSHFQADQVVLHCPFMLLPQSLDQLSFLFLLLLQVLNVRLQKLLVLFLLHLLFYFGLFNDILDFVLLVFRKRRPLLFASALLQVSNGLLKLLFLLLQVSDFPDGPLLAQPNVLDKFTMVLLQLVRGNRLGTPEEWLLLTGDDQLPIFYFLYYPRCGLDAGGDVLRELVHSVPYILLFLSHYYSHFIGDACSRGGPPALVTVSISYLNEC